MSLIGHWTLAQDNYSGGVFQDLSGNGNNGTPANTPVFTANQQGRTDRALTFNGSTDLISVTGGTDYSTAQGSIAVWAKFTALGSRECLFYVYETGGSWTDYLTFDKLDTNNMYLGIEDDDAFIVELQAASIADTGWHHCMVTADGADIKIYIDGAYVNGVSNASWTSHLTSNNVQFGKNNWGTLDGAMCNVRVYDNTLTPTEVASLYNSELFWNPLSFTGSMNFSASLSARNAKWLLIDNRLNWRGEWDAAYSYDIDDTILYRTGTGNEFHVFVSKTGHNTNNIPTVSPAYWRRYYQEQFL